MVLWFGTAAYVRFAHLVFEAGVSLGSDAGPLWDHRGDAIRIAGRFMRVAGQARDQGRRGGRAGGRSRAARADHDRAHALARRRAAGFGLGYAHEGRGHTSRVHQLPGDARARFRTDVEPAHARGVADRSRCVRAGRDAAARRTRYHPRGRQRARDPGQAAVRWGSVRARSATIPSARRRRSSRQRGRRGRHARLEHTRVAPRTGSRGLARRSAARERRLHDEGDALRKCRGVGPRCGAACPARLHG